ncbi:hypothetical protein SOVF_201390, partial [Spinacia oleracea]
PFPLTTAELSPSSSRPSSSSHHLKFSTMNAQRDHDEIMGSARNFTEEERTEYKEIMWDDKEL